MNHIINEDGGTHGSHGFRSNELNPGQQHRQEGPPMDVSTSESSVPTMPMRIQLEEESNGTDAEWCRHCNITTTPKWCTGPDGIRTLCLACGLRYVRKRMIIYRRKDGRLTAVARRDCEEVKVVGFRKRTANSNDLRYPSVISIETESGSRNAEDQINDSREIAQEEGNKSRTMNVTSRQEKDNDEEIGNESKGDDEVPHQGQGQKENWCRKCKVSNPSHWRTGPDGYKTLCTSCSLKYARMEMVIFQDSKGRLSAAAKPGWQPVAITGFNHSPSGQSRDLRAPKVRPMSPVEVETKDNLEASRSAPSGSNKPTPTSSRLPVSAAQMNDLTREEEENVDGDFPVPRETQENKKSRPVNGTPQRNPGREVKLRCKKKRMRAEWEMEKAAEALEANSGLIRQNADMSHFMRASYTSGDGHVLTKCLHVTEGLSFKELENQFYTIFKLECYFTVTYEDIEGDSIVISSNNELTMMLIHAKDAEISPIRIQIVLKKYT